MGQNADNQSSEKHGEGSLFFYMQINTKNFL